MSQRGKLDKYPFGSWNVDIAAGKNEEVHWVWDGFIPWPGITLLTGASMLGKSTLVGMLLERRRQGGELLGRRVQDGTTVVVSEEDEAVWARRQQRLDFGPNVFFCRPELPTLGRWRHFCEQLLNLYVSPPFELVVIDSLASFVPAAENDARSLRKAIEELRFTDFLSVGVLLGHHARRAGGRPGSAIRGSGALPALADVLLDLRLWGNDPFSRRRRLYGLGRYPEIPQRLLIEMNADDKGYTVLADTEEDAALFTPVLDAVRNLLAQAEAPLTRQEILERWPDPARRPPPTTLWRWLARGCKLGLLVHHGDGSKLDAFRYALADSARVPASRTTTLSASAASATAEASPTSSPPATERQPVVISIAELLAQNAPHPAPPAEARAPEARVPVPGENPPAVEPSQPAQAAAPATAQDATQSALTTDPTRPSIQLHDLPEHARWLYYLVQGAPEDRDRAG